MPISGRSREQVLADYARFTENFITVEECERRFPGWLAAREEAGNAHVMDPVLQAFVSRFQTTQRLIAMKFDPETGRMAPDFDRVIVNEAANVHINCYDVEDGVWYFGTIIQIRQFPEGPRPALVGEIPKGFNLDRILGEGSGAVEAADEAAVREALEELGLPLKGIPKLLKRMRKGNTADAQCVSDVYEVHVDMKGVVSTAPDPSEHIVMSEILPLSEYGRRMRRGIDEDGISWDAGADMATLMCFLMEHPDAAGQFFGIY